MASTAENNNNGFVGDVDQGDITSAATNSQPDGQTTSKGNQLPRDDTRIGIGAVMRMRSSRQRRVARRRQQLSRDVSTTFMQISAAMMITCLTFAFPAAAKSTVWVIRVEVMIHSGAIFLMVVGIHSQNYYEFEAAEWLERVGHVFSVAGIILFPALFIALPLVWFLVLFLALVLIMCALIHVGSSSPQGPGEE